MSWDDVTSNRFVLFFDILGFKDLVSRSSHEEVLKKLKKLKGRASKLEIAKLKKTAQEKYNIDIRQYQTKSVTFSDSIIFFSEGDTTSDFLKILIDSQYMLNEALSIGLALKGAISYGRITVDFEQNIFFGQPIIDAFLLHEDLHMLDVILDHNCDLQKDKYNNIFINENIKFLNVKMKYGHVSHSIVIPRLSSKIDEKIILLKKLYYTTSGSPRAYIDNSVKFYESISQEKADV